MINYKFDTPNCLDYYDDRRRRIPPPHFKYSYLYNAVVFQSNNIAHWITNHLKGRFFLDESFDEENPLGFLQVGFEDPVELTQFLLACPYTRSTI